MKQKGARSEKREARAAGSLRETGESGTGSAQSSLDSTHDQRRALGRAGPGRAGPSPPVPKEPLKPNGSSAKTVSSSIGPALAAGPRVCKDPPSFIAVRECIRRTLVINTTVVYCKLWVSEDNR